MGTNVRLQVMLSPKIIEKVQKLTEMKGLSKAAIVTIAVEKLWKEEGADEE